MLTSEDAKQKQTPDPTSERSDQLTNSNVPLTGRLDSHGRMKPPQAQIRPA